MTEAQKHQLQKYIVMQDTIMHSPEILDQKPHIKPYFIAFSQHIQLLQKIKIMIEDSSKINNDYIPLRPELEQTILLFSRKITAFAQLEELTELQGIFCYSPDELARYPDEKLLETGKIILSKAKEYLENIKVYKISHTTISEFQYLINQYAVQLQDKKLQTQMMEIAENDISNLLSVSEKIFNNQLIELISSEASN